MVILDQATRQKVPGAANLFLNPPYNMSGSFNSPNTGEIQKVHINPNQSVKLAQDKAALLRFLEQAGLPVGNHKAMEAFVRSGAFSLPAFEDQFKYEESPVEIRSNKGAIEVGEYEDLLHFLSQMHNHPGAVAVKSNFEAPMLGTMRAIPPMDGKQLNIGSRIVTDGVLAHNFPKGPQQANHLAAGKEALGKMGLDYGCVFIKFDPTGSDFEILEVMTDLKREDAIGLRSYADVLQKQQLKHGKNKR